MLRPNLLRCLTFTLLAVGCFSTVLAQYPYGNCPTPGMQMPHSQYQAPIIDYNVGQKPKLWDDQQPIERLLTNVAQRSWVRFEYLHWQLARPGSQIVGAPVIGGTDPQTVFDNLNGGVSAGVGVTPNLNNVGLDDASGVRGTWGLDLNNAEFELEFFGTAETTDTFSFRNLSFGRDTGLESQGTPERPNIVTPLLNNGSPSAADAANYLIYDDSFSAELTGQMWGAEAMLLSKTYIPGDVFQMQWLGGFRYVAYEEKYGHRGVFNNGGLAATDTVSQVRATTVNNMYGPEVGARASINTKYLTFSATPRIAFTLNDYTGETFAGPLAGTADGTSTHLSGSSIDFTPIVQVSLTGELHVTPNFSIFGGYDFMWIYRMTRPFDNIVYNSVDGGGGSFAPQIEQQIDLESFYTRGLTAGLIFRY